MNLTGATNTPQTAQGGVSPVSGLAGAANSTQTAQGNVSFGYTIRSNIHSPTSIHGKSAYEIALIHGFRGTEEEWLESLKGDGSDIDFATDEEVTEILETVYGDNPDNIPEDDLITEDDFATDEEVEDMLNGIFGSN